MPSYEERIDRLEEWGDEALPLSGALMAKVSQAKAKLLVESPYFGTLASRLELARNDSIGSFLSDGARLEFHDGYLEGLSLDELGFALANGAMHAALSHESRQKGRMGWLWQLATDYAINGMLVENGLTAPEGIHYDPRFEGMYAEAIYAQLKDEIQNEAYDDDESNETGLNEGNQRHQQQMRNAEGDHDPDGARPQMEVENEHRALNDISDHTAQEEALEQMARDLLAKMEKMGELPGGIERFFERDAEPKVDWRQELHQLVTSYYRNDYRVMPPSKKLLYAGTYLPSLDSEMFQAVLAVDSSGSVDEGLLGVFIAEMESLMLSFPNYLLEVLVCDAKIQSHSTVSGGERLEVALKGGGGTDFRPVFEYIEQHLPDAQLLLYFTDGEGRFPEVEPLYETVWVTPEPCEVPFGQRIVLAE